MEVTQPKPDMPALPKSDLTNTGGLQWIADHDQKHSALFHEMFDSAEVKAYRLQEVETKAAHAEQMSIKASNDSAIARENAEKCAAMVSNAQDYTRMCKSINADINHSARVIRMFSTIGLICNAIVVVVLILVWLWR